MSDTQITIHIDDDCFGDEGEGFAMWCSAHGYEVTEVRRVSGMHPELPEGLWDRYCAYIEGVDTKRDDELAES